MERDKVKKGHICDAINESDEPNIEVIQHLDIRLIRFVYCVTSATQ